MEKEYVITLSICLTIIFCTILLWVGPFRYKMEAASGTNFIFALDTVTGDIFITHSEGKKMIPEKWYKASF